MENFLKVRKSASSRERCGRVWGGIEGKRGRGRGKADEKSSSSHVRSPREKGERGSAGVRLLEKGVEVARIGGNDELFKGEVDEKAKWKVLSWVSERNHG